MRPAFSGLVSILRRSTLMTGATLGQQVLRSFPSIQALLGRLKEKCDIIHLIADVSEAGKIRHATGMRSRKPNSFSTVVITTLSCYGSSDNAPERYTNGFGARGKRQKGILQGMRTGSLRCPSSEAKSNRIAKECTTHTASPKVIQRE